VNHEVYFRVFAHSNCRLVAVCDIDLIGETFREGKLKLEVKPDFYKGTASNISEVLPEIEAADTANLVGERIVGAAVRQGLIHPSAIVRIAGVPHVQIVRL
jgi:hypothetical protein